MRAPASFACSIGTPTCIEYSYAAIDPQTLTGLRAACAGSLLTSCPTANSIGACRMTITASNGITGTSTTRYYQAPGVTGNTYRSACTMACSTGSGTSCTWL